MPTKNFDDLSVHEKRRLVARAALRTIVTVALVVAVYFLVPMDRAISAATVAELVLGVLVFFGVIIWQVRQISRSEHPGVRAVEALAFTLPVYILLFATTYYLMDHANATTFTQPLSRIDSMYFSVTVFTTVGFGDITAKARAARVIVTYQMILDLVIVGVVLRLVVNAIKIGRQRQTS
jgi:voltage-gated potassium channel